MEIMITKIETAKQWDLSGDIDGQESESDGFIRWKTFDGTEFLVCGDEVFTKDESGCNELPKAKTFSLIKTMDGKIKGFRIYLTEVQELLDRRGHYAWKGLRLTLWTKTPIKIQ